MAKEKIMNLAMQEYYDEKIKAYITAADEEKLAESTVRYDTAQSLADDEKAQARANIDAVKVVAQASAPSDTSVIWIDTDDSTGEEENRTHYEEFTEFCPESVAIFDGEMAYYEGLTSKPLTIGKQYRFTVNGVENIVTAISMDGMPMITLEDGSIFYTMDNGDGSYMGMALFATTEDVTFKVDEVNIVTVPEKFLPYSARGYNLVFTEEEWGDTQVVELERSCDDFIEFLWNGGTVNIIRISENSRSSSQVISWTYLVIEGGGILALEVLDKRFLMTGTWIPPTE